MRRWRLHSLRVIAALLVLALFVILAGVLVLRSGWFQEQVRMRIIAELEKATGGRAELGQFSFDWTGLRANVSSLVVHGKELPGEPPFLRIASVSLGLRIISALKQDVDLAEVVVQNPEVHLVVYPDGSTNLPSPGQRAGRAWTEPLLNLKVQRYAVIDGLFEFDQRKVPLDIQGEKLQIKMSYDAAIPSYKGRVTSDRVRVLPAGYGPIEASVDGDFVIEKSRIVLPRVAVRTAESRADLDGVFEDVRAPRGTFNLKATAGVGEAVRIFRLPIGPQGSAGFNGKLQLAFEPDFFIRMTGKATALGLGYVRDRLKIENASGNADLDLNKDGLTLRGIRAQALDADISGSADLQRWRQFHFDGQIEGLGLRRAAAVVTDKAIAWNGTVNGGFTLDTGIRGDDAKIRTNLAIVRGGEGIPVDGQIDAAYDHAAGLLGLGSSWVATPASRIDFSGTMGQTLKVKLRTENPDDLLPAIAMAMPDSPDHLLLKLMNGSATADGLVTGTIEDPHFAGQAVVVNGSVEGHGFDRLTADLTVAKREVAAERLTLRRGATEVSGSAKIVDRGNGFADGGITASLNVRNADVAQLIREAGENLNVSGTASATIRVAGSVQNPEGDMTADILQASVFGEQMGRLRSTVRFKGDLLEVVSGEAVDGAASAQFNASYRRIGGNWKTGDLTFAAATRNLPFTRIEYVKGVEPGFDGILTGRVGGAGRIVNGQFNPKDVTADLTAERFTIDGKPMGNIGVNVSTKDGEMDVLATDKIRESSLEVRGKWRLEGQYPGSGTLSFTRVSLESLHSLANIGSGQPEPDDPFEGFIEGSATFSMPLLAPKALKAELTLSSLQITPKASQAARLGVLSTDIVLRNNQPVIIDLSATEARVRQAQFSGRDTSLQVSGTIPFARGGTADLTLRGNLNLILLQLYDRDLLAKGDAQLQASIRGNIQDPSVNARLELKGAELYLEDLPQGVVNANGVIAIDRNRATIEKLTAETGGGTVTLGGVVEFGKTLVYRLQATAQQVRIRWPEDLSSTYNARLTLSGTSEASTMAGTLTLNRAAFNPRTDLGQLLAQASKPVPAPATPNEYLRGMQFDVRIESGPNFGFETSLTRDVQAEVDLHLRGTPLRPSLLGSISVNQGEVQVFGNRYAIERGDIRFLNPAKIEPRFDIDLSTRARGITVNVSFSGIMGQQVKFNYSSDPPLQASEILALLTVGRDPLANNSSSLTSAGRSPLVEAGNGLIGQAVSAQISSRLQRFFGASRVKIDPTLTGVDNLPQARLTIEQQVSKDITLTYITNLNRTQEQLVRVQWDLNRNWSAIAVRDPNGLFGVDFQYRKRF